MQSHSYVLGAESSGFQLRRKPLIYTSTSPIYGGGARRAEGALAKVALIVSGNTLQPLRGHPPTRGKRLTAHR